MPWYSLTNLGSGASILGLVTSIFALVKISSVKKSIGQNSVRRTVDRLFQEIENISEEKQGLTPSQANALDQLLNYVEIFFMSRWRPKHKVARQLHSKIRKELGCSPQVANIKRDASMLRDQFFMIS